MAQLFFGIDIGSKYTKVAVLEHGVKTRLVNAFLFPSPVKAGKDGDKQVIPEEFLKELSKYIPVASFRKAKIAVNLPPMSITAISVFLPLMSRKELSFAAINEAKQKMIPVAGPNHIFDCLFLGETLINKVSRAEVLVIRTEKIFVERILDICKVLGEYPALISPASTILPNVLPKDAWRKDQALVIVDIGAAFLKISICSEGNMVFMRNVVFGLEDIIQDFARQLGIPAKRAEEIIREHGVPKVAFDPKDKVAIAEEIMRQKYEASLAQPDSAESQVNLLELRLFWQPHLERIAQELRRSFVFYNERSEGKRIEQVFFSGGGSHIKNLREILSSFIGGECREIQPFAQVTRDLSKDNKFGEEVVSSAIFASAASLAYGIPFKKKVKDVQINFLPQEIKQREAVAARRTVFLAIGAFLIAGFILATAQLFLSNQAMKSDIRAVDKKLEKVKRVVEDLKILSKSQDKIRDRGRQIDELVKMLPDYASILKGLSEATPKEVLLKKCVLIENKMILEASVVADYEATNSIIDSFKSSLVKTGRFSEVNVPPIELEPFSPELGPAGAGQQLRLTVAKQRDFRLSAQVSVPVKTVAPKKSGKKGSKIKSKAVAEDAAKKAGVSDKEKKGKGEEIE